MTDPQTILVAAALTFGALVVLAHAALTGWRGWLDLRRLELAERRVEAPATGAGTRIELADLRERIRKLEAIAAGVEL